MIQAAQLGVNIGQFEQPLLCLGRCFHGPPR
jgi:hypothetical protein